MRRGRVVEDENRGWQQAIGIALGLSVLALVAGYLGFLHPLGDSLSVGRGIAAVAVLILAVFASFAGLRMAAFVSMLLALLACVQVMLAYSWPGVPGRYTVYQKNMLYRNAELPALEADIRATDAQIVTLQEVSTANQALVEALSDIYPTRHVCPGGTVGGQAILTRLDPVAGTAFCGPNMAALQVVAGEERFWLVSLHLYWPWPYRQADQVELLLPILDRLEGHVVMAGDFNMVRWANSVTRLAAIVETRPAGPTFGSYIGLSKLAPLPIDHVFAPQSGRVTPRPALGSDHLGLLAEVEL
ncbi:endonuclease/exonuclease/phosphatase family protein [Tabrizicola sp.]|uniref:endonuclease/exonuclease/phosphatase family protein n=1 Tax=Tabrizicola sp. TaxID=2005166 RepID=UPI0035B4DA8D